MSVEIRHTKSQINNYHKKIRNLVLLPLQKNIIEKIAVAPDHKEAWQNAIDVTFNDNDYLTDVDTGSEVIATQHINDLSQWQRKKIITQFAQMFSIDILPLLNEYNTKNELDPIITDNINLIKSIPFDLLNQVNNQFNDIIYESGFDQKAILNMLTRRFSVANSRAMLISSDQTGKTIGALAKIRQKQAGVSRFKWRTSEDERVRPDHQSLDNRIFNWNSPPDIGIPGQPIRCRCVAIPIIDSLS